MIPERWEHGSDHHWMDPTGTASYAWNERGSLFGNGRFALNAAVDALGCTRLWIPSFYCPEVIVALPLERLAIAVYRDSPTAPVTSFDSLDLRAGDAILVLNTYGLRAGPPTYPAGVPIIEDHTHDLQSAWARASRADYCIASLRKILPVPDGGVVWAPGDRPAVVEPPLDPLHASAALDRLTGILLKTGYLGGGAVDKATYRDHAVAGETALAKGPASTILPFTRAALPGFPTERWRATRRENFEAFDAALGDAVPLLRPASGAVAFVATLELASQAARDALRARLIAEKIYPAVLWPFDHAVYPIPEEDRDLARRILSLHCDQRYSVADMECVARVVRS